MISSSQVFQWFSLLAMLAIAVGGVVAAALLLERGTRSIFWQRTIWQTAIAGILVVTVLELLGARAGFTRWLRPDGVIWLVEAAGAREEGKGLAIAGEPVPAAASVRSPNDSADRQLAPPQKRWMLLTAGIWATGTFILLARIILGQFTIAFLHRQKGALPPAFEERMILLGRKLGLRRIPLSIVSPRFAEPFAFGVIRPRIGLPTGFGESFNLSQQEAMLAHEMAHLAALDPAWNLLAQLTVALVWWHPLAWVARWRLDFATEAAADQASLLIQDGPDLLAECLIQLGRRLSVRTHSGSIGIDGSGFRSSLGRRVERLIRLQPSSWQPPAPIRHNLARCSGLGAVLIGIAAGTGLIAKEGIPFVHGHNPASLIQLALLAAASPEPATPGSSRGGSAAEVPPTRTPPGSDASRPTETTSRTTAVPELVTRTYKVDPYSILNGLDSFLLQNGRPSLKSGKDRNEIMRDIQPSLRLFFETLGVSPFATGLTSDQSQTPAIFFNDRTGIVFVRATLKDHQIIESALHALNSAPTQVTLEARILELPNPDLPKLGLDWLSSNPAVGPGSAPSPAPTTGALTQAATNAVTITGILTDPQFRVFVRALEQRGGWKTLSSPRITTLSGRAAVLSMLEDPTESEAKDDLPPAGTTIEVLPRVNADGISIELDVHFTLVEKEKPSGLDRLPRVRRQELTTTARVWDGQTLFLRGVPSGEGNEKKTLLLFITPVITDPAGNRFHPEPQP